MIQSRSLNASARDDTKAPLNHQAAAAAAATIAATAAAIQGARRVARAGTRRAVDAESPASDWSSNRTSRIDW